MRIINQCFLEGQQSNEANPLSLKSDTPITEIKSCRLMWSNLGLVIGKQRLIRHENSYRM